MSPAQPFCIDQHTLFEKLRAGSAACAFVAAVKFCAPIVASRCW